MKYTKEKFLKDVKKEATALRDNATDEEKYKLNFDRLNPNDYHRCIYGQMTGHCRSNRAIDLITSCCKRFILNEFVGTPKKFTDVKNKINGITSESPGTTEYISSIETYILFNKANNKSLIDYIKGETKKLVL